MVDEALAAGGTRAAHFRRGMLSGYHYVETVGPIKQLKREGRLEEALLSATAQLRPLRKTARDANPLLGTPIRQPSSIANLANARKRKRFCVGGFRTARWSSDPLQTSKRGWTNWLPNRRASSVCGTAIPQRDTPPHMTVEEVRS
jgi:hypothetical protein